MARTTFTSVELKKFGRDDRGGHATWVCPLTKTVAVLMGWDEMPECYAGGSLSTELAARIVELTPNDEGLARHAITLDIQKMHSFQVVRREIEGKRDKGTRVDLIFKTDFADAKGCRKLEEYKLVASKSKMRVEYEPAAVQETLPGTEDEQEPPISTKDTGCVSCNAGIAFEPSGRKHITGQKCSNQERADARNKAKATEAEKQVQ